MKEAGLGDRQPMEEEGPKMKREKQTPCLRSLVPNSGLPVVLINQIRYGFSQLESFLLFEVQSMLSVRKGPSSQLCLGRDPHLRVD